MLLDYQIRGRKRKRKQLAVSSFGGDSHLQCKSSAATKPFEPSPILTDPPAAMAICKEPSQAGFLIMKKLDKLSWGERACSKSGKPLAPKR